MTILFQDGMEDRTFARWTLGASASGGGSTPVILPQFVWKGSYAAKFVLDATLAASSRAKTALGASIATAYARCYLMLIDAPVNTKILMVGPNVMTVTEYDLASAMIINDAGTLKWVLKYQRQSGGWIVSTVTDATGADCKTRKWYCVECGVTVSATVGIATLYVNGRKLLEVTGLDNNDDGNIIRFRNGSNNYTNTGANTLYTDNYKISDQYIGPEPLDTIQSLNPRPNSRNKMFFLRRGLRNFQPYH